MQLILLAATSAILPAFFGQENTDDIFRVMKDAGVKGDTQETTRDNKGEIAALWNAIISQQGEIVALRQELTDLKQTVSGQETLIQSQKDAYMLLEKRMQTDVDEDKQMATSENTKEVGVDNFKMSDENLQFLGAIDGQINEKATLEEEPTKRTDNVDVKMNIAKDEHLSSTLSHGSISNIKQTAGKSKEEPSVVHYRNSPETASDHQRRMLNPGITVARVAFSAYLDNKLTQLSTGHVIKCNKPLLNIGNAYNAHTGVFTVPTTGVYLLTFTICDNAPGHWTFVKLVVDDRNLVDAVLSPVPSGFSDFMGGNTAIVQLSASESVWLEVYNTATGELESEEKFRYVTFSGVLLF